MQSFIFVLRNFKIANSFHSIISRIGDEFLKTTVVILHVLFLYKKANKTKNWHIIVSCWVLHEKHAENTWHCNEIEHFNVFQNFYCIIPFLPLLLYLNLIYVPCYMFCKYYLTLVSVNITRHICSVISSVFWVIFHKPQFTFRNAIRSFSLYVLII